MSTITYHGRDSSDRIRLLSIFPTNPSYPFSSSTPARRSPCRNSLQKLNHVDLLYAQGKTSKQHVVDPPRRSPWGSNFLGTVFAVGSTATADGPQFNPGDKVFGAGLGAYAEWIVVPARSLHHIPHNWTFEDAAGLAATANVAYGAVAIRGRVKEGDWVMVHGAAGGIGVYACQIAKALGAKVIAGVRDTRNSEKVGILRTNIAETSCHNRLYKPINAVPGDADHLLSLILSDTETQIEELPKNQSKCGEA
ncbi:alcohol dehydrogenase [Coccidioides immitis RMSCC 3703]|uniref:Alcohol dehydrogenase n=1 Tax=Coccidioides immitis RMSCC 3703 TaxID=454286 RepID=A0A0J8R968_COCIT|nr:alcohol dehydrogenase [Coccidioides immitis RMSCC 3703]